jgi:hypothetical protein
MARKQTRSSTNNGANLGFEQKLWQAADKLRNNMDAAARGLTHVCSRTDLRQPEEV